METKHKPATALLTVKWTDNAVMLCHPEIGVVRMLRDSGGAHCLEEIAAKHNAYPQLVAALRASIARMDKSLAGARRNQMHGTHGQPDSALPSPAEAREREELRALLRSLGEME